MKRLTGIRRLLTLQETRRAVLSTLRSGVVRDLGRRARSDRAALLQELRNPANARAYLLAAARHPATHELATVGMMALPSRYLRLAWVALRVAGRLTRRPGRREADSW